jgi:hypothetical protein
MNHGPIHAVTHVDRAVHAVIYRRRHPRHTTKLRITALLAIAEEVVIAWERIRTGLAHAVSTAVAHRAGISVVAGGLVQNGLTPKHDVADIVRTGVPVSAVHVPLRHAKLVHTGVPARAGVAIVAVELVGRKRTPQRGIAGVVRAAVSVLAVQRLLPRLAASVPT